MRNVRNKKPGNDTWGEEIKLPNQEKISTLGKKKTYKYSGILDADTIKQVKMREKIKKSISRESESYSRQNYIAGTL